MSSLLWGNSITFNAANPNGLHDLTPPFVGVGETPQMIMVVAPTPVSWDVFINLESANGANLPVNLLMIASLRLGIGRMHTRAWFAFTNGAAPLQVRSFSASVPNVPAESVSGTVVLATGLIGADTWVVSMGIAPRTPLSAAKAVVGSHGTLDEASEQYQYLKDWR